MHSVARLIWGRGTTPVVPALGTVLHTHLPATSDRPLRLRLLTRNERTRQHRYPCPRLHRPGATQSVVLQPAHRRGQLTTAGCPPATDYDSLSANPVLCVTCLNGQSEHLRYNAPRCRSQTRLRCSFPWLIPFCRPRRGIWRWHCLPVVVLLLQCSQACVTTAAVLALT